MPALIRAIPILFALGALLTAGAASSAPLEIGPRDLVGLAGVPAIIALTQVVKGLWPTLEARWYPVVALTFGLAINLALITVTGASPIEAAAVGIIAALTASGLYSQVMSYG